MTGGYSPGEVEALADVMAEARLSGMVTGTRRMARHLLDAGYRQPGPAAKAAYGRGRDDEAAGMPVPVEMR